MLFNSIQNPETSFQPVGCCAHDYNGYGRSPSLLDSGNSKLETIFEQSEKIMEQYLELGKVNNTHGLKGEVKFEMWCDGIEYVKQLKTVYLDKNGTKPLTLVSARPQKNIAILKFAEIPSINEAEEIKGKVLYCNRDDVPIDDGAYYHADIIGCYVVDIDTEEEYGKVVDVQNYGSCDIYDIESWGKHTLIPAIPDVIKEIDTEYQVIRIKPMKGLFDED